MESAKKILLFSVGVILTVGFIAIAMSLFNKSKTSLSNTSAQYDSLVSQYSDIEYALYESAGSTASGSELCKLITGLKDESISIYVSNGTWVNDKDLAESEGVLYKNSKENECGFEGTKLSYAEAVKKMNDRNDKKFYINPMASFSCVIERDYNGIISSLSFRQK